VPELIDHGKTGFLIEGEEIEEFADKIEYLIKNPQLRTNMGKKRS